MFKELINKFYIIVVLIFLGNCLNLNKLESAKSKVINEKETTNSNNSKEFTQLATSQRATPLDSIEIYQSSNSEDEYLGHGEYTEDYQSDWSTLPNGKEWERTYPNTSEYKDLALTKSNIYYVDDNYVKIDGVPQDTRISASGGNYISIENINAELTSDFSDGSYIYIENYDKIVIKNLFIKQMDAEPTAKHTIWIQNCGEVIIKDSYFEGPVLYSHIRIRGCESVFIDNVEIAGRLETDGRYSNGGGIYIENGYYDGDGDYDINEGEYEPDRELESLVVQNCYLHDYTKPMVSGNDYNQDGINITSASDGILFNNYISNWIQRQGGDECGPDSAIDIGHHRLNDSEYQNKVLRIERNIFSENSFVKVIGNSDNTNYLFFANNIYNNTALVDYHQTYSVYHLFETYAFNENDNGNGTDNELFNFWYPNSTSLKHEDLSLGSTIFANNIVWAKGDVFQSAYSINVDTDSDSKAYGYDYDDYKTLIQPDYNVYLIDKEKEDSNDGDKYKNFSWIYMGDDHTFIEDDDTYASKYGSFEGNYDGFCYYQNSSFSAGCEGETEDSRYAGQDLNSYYNYENISSCFKDPDSLDFSLKSSLCPAYAFANPSYMITVKTLTGHAGMEVRKDFIGATRDSTSPSAGVYEGVSKVNKVDLTNDPRNKSKSNKENNNPLKNKTEGQNVKSKFNNKNGRSDSLINKSPLHKTKS